MRRIFLFVSILLLAPALTFADTIILKNGRKINCDVARQEGSIVRYWIGDISLRIAAEEVEKIERNEERGEGLKASPTTDSINSATSTITSEPSRLTAEAFKQLEERVFSGRADQQQKISFVNHLNSLASDAYTKGRREEAKSHLLKAAQVDNQNSVTFINLAVVTYTEGRYSESLSFAQKAVDIDPNNQATYYQLGIAYYALEKLPQAIDAWKKALKIGANAKIDDLLKKAEKEAAIAGEFNKSRSRFFNISIEGAHLNTSFEAEIVSLLEETYSTLRQKFGYTPTEKISAVFYTETTFSNITNAPSWVGALNDGKLRIPVGGLDSVNDELSRTITHELTHSFIRFKAQGRCPTWLNEGIAQIMEGRISSKDRLAKAESLVSLKMLEGSFMNFSTSTASVAYSYSLFATEVLAERGNTTLMKILEDLGQNIGIDAALSRNTRYKNLEDLENEMKRRLSQ